MGEVVPEGADSQNIKPFPGQPWGCIFVSTPGDSESLNDFPSLMSLVLDARPETSELHSKVTSGENQTAWASSIPLAAVLSQTRNGVYLCFQCRCQKAGEQLARAAHLGEGAGQELCTPASPGAEGHDPFQQRQQLHVRIPRGQSQQQRGAATL